MSRSLNLVAAEARGAYYAIRQAIMESPNISVEYKQAALDGFERHCGNIGAIKRPSPFHYELIQLFDWDSSGPIYPHGFTWHYIHKEVESLRRAR